MSWYNIDEQTYRQVQRWNDGWRPASYWMGLVSGILLGAGLVIVGAWVIR